MHAPRQRVIGLFPSGKKENDLVKGIREGIRIKTSVTENEESWYRGAGVTLSAPDRRTDNL